MPPPTKQSSIGDGLPKAWPGPAYVRKATDLRKPLDLLRSASKTSFLTKQRTVHATKSIDPRAQPLLPHTQATTGDVSAHVAMVLVDVSLLDTKQMRSRLLTSFCQLHKSDQKHMSHKSLYIKTWFVCSNKFECLKTLKHFKHQNIYDVPLDLLATPILNAFRTLLAVIMERQKTN